MIRTITALTAFSLLIACSDGRGSQYSSARASVPQPTYIPVTPGATPVDTAPVGAIPVSVVPAGTPVTPLPQATPVAAAPIPVTPTQTPAPQQETVTQAAAALPRTPAAPEPVSRFATGPINTACLNADRKAASRARCGCVQWVANQELSPADQRRGAGYFSNQHGLQEVRQSSESIPSNERFWKVWKAYGASAASQCRGT